MNEIATEKAIENTNKTKNLFTEDIKNSNLLLGSPKIGEGRQGS